MSLPNIPQIPNVPCIPINVSLSLILVSIALEEIGLSHIIKVSLKPLTVARLPSVTF